MSPEGPGDPGDPLDPPVPDPDPLRPPPLPHRLLAASDAPATFHDPRVVNDPGSTLPHERPVERAPCPACGAPVLWAEAFTDTESTTATATGVAVAARGSQRVLCEPEAEQVEDLLPEQVWVTRGPSGRMMLCRPARHRRHHCDPGVLHPAAGAYTAAVLAEPCTAEFCRVVPGSLCVSMRGEVLVRPHGVRAAAAAARTDP